VSTIRVYFFSLFPLLLFHRLDKKSIALAKKLQARDNVDIKKQSNDTNLESIRISNEDNQDAVNDEQINSSIDTDNEINIHQVSYVDEVKNEANSVYDRLHARGRDYARKRMDWKPPAVNV
jgi:hypothetical protein